MAGSQPFGSPQTAGVGQWLTDEDESRNSSMASSRLGISGRHRRPAVGCQVPTLSLTKPSRNARTNSSCIAVTPTVTRSRTGCKPSGNCARGCRSRLSNGSEARRDARRQSSERHVDAGSCTRTVVPPPDGHTTSMRPEWASMRRLEVESPSPVPRDLVVKNGVKILSRISDGIPGP